LASQPETPPTSLLGHRGEAGTREVRVVLGGEAGEDFSGPGFGP